MENENRLKFGKWAMLVTFVLTIVISLLLVFTMPATTPPVEQDWPLWRLLLSAIAVPPALYAIWMASSALFVWGYGERENRRVWMMFFARAGGAIFAGFAVSLLIWIAVIKISG